ncbi:helix-turn-helix transcriptional regulator [Saccharothrix coeruleofusca]|uniref:Helix-turn-helix transcriptional regulator n=1 Tax=Saccharothrix coeruleofusca TaxID=33919 RepID=A0A918EB89_9PSEU|nr:helix-turn-helix transcriptional regulator [Saccharothrix coeruleofusca]
MPRGAGTPTGMANGVSGGSSASASAAAEPGVALVDPVPLYREGVCAVVRRTAGVRWLGAAGRVEHALRLCEQLAPDVLLVDSVLDAQGCLASELMTAAPRVAVVSLVREPHRTVKFVRTALGSGVRGLVPRAAEPAEVVHAILRTHQERLYLDPTLAPLAAGFTPAVEAGSRRALSRREYEVLRLIAEGLENQAVADELYVSVETVRTHVKNILRKLRARDRTHAVSLAYQSGLLTGRLNP